MDELIIDSFAGGGGASLGITWALGRHPDIAINHDAAAITMHKANHPTTTHYIEDVWKLSPREVTGGKPVGLLWASPDCKHFSRAKGGKPVEKKIRSLAWVVAKWAEQSSPRLIILENVREFEQWGPLVPRWQCQECTWKGTEGQATLARQRRACPHCDASTLKKTDDLMPDPDRSGLTFKRFTGRLRNLGYDLQWRVLNAADYGAPTHRRRLFLIARRDGCAIVWPKQTHGDPKKAHQHGLLPWRTAAECIDWSLPCPSIFERKKPLADKTMRRIALGIKRYVVDNPRPFIVCCNHGWKHFRGQSIDRPLCTLTAARDAYGVVMPVLEKCKRKTDAIAPTLIQTGYGERPGQSPRQLNMFKPMGTVVAGGSKQGLIAAFLHRYYGGSVGQTVDQLGPSESQNGHTSVVAAYLAKHYGGVVGVSVDTPLPTTTARGTQNQVVTANLIHMNHGAKQWSGMDEPMFTATAGGNHAFLVYSFLIKYFGTAIGQSIEEPMHTATSKDHFGVVTVEIEGQTYVIVDIGMRMLTPRELAKGQGFPDDYILTGSNTSQVAKIGNSVSPPPAQALVSANWASERLSSECVA
ncbi:MAG: DNA cytosine methyltransferase [Nitrospirota bacterium]|nr:DNA cytosine methyltransferase [Nitrospirota bacterium]